ncbi:hypothetical protein HRbin15_00640 [bacterium HR15]|nr:hypothetical protein HRbin15_00640 [bacterium HR15]
MSRPTAVTVIGVIGIVLGILGLCGGLCGLAAGPLAGTFAEMAPPDAQSPQMQLLKDPTYMRLTVLQSLVGVVLAIALLVSAIMLLRMSPLGYNLMIVYSVIAILWTLVSLVLAFTVMNSIQQRVLGSTPEAGAAMAGGLIGGFLGAAVSIIYPVVVLIVLTRPAIKERFTT